MFETFAHDLKLEGSCDFPAIIASYDDAKKVFTEILTLLVKYEKKNKKISEKSNKFLNIKFWYGLAYHELSNFLKQDPAQQRKLAQKSLELWSSLLTNSFRSEDLLEYSKASNVEALEIYQTLYIKQSTNYDHILRYKVNYMIHLDFFEAKPYIMVSYLIFCCCKI